MFAALRRPLDFSGRAPRPEFWGWVVLFLVAEGLAFLASTPGALTAWLLLAVVPHAAVTMRRLHDLDASGWWVAPHLLLLMAGTLGTDLLAFRIAADGGAEVGGNAPAQDAWLTVPLFANNLAYLVYTVALAVALARDGTAGPNRFGADPKGRNPDGPPPLDG